MDYIYPKFSKKSIGTYRIGGPGLGNLLFTYSRALIISDKYNLKLIWPNWPSIKIGPWIRNERDKRLYNDLFINNSNYIDGLEKLKLLMFAIKKRDFQDVNLNDKHIENTILVCENNEMKFEDLIEFRELIYLDLIHNLNPKYKEALEYNFENSINVHIRLGDFTTANIQALTDGENNISIPIEWYVNMIKQIKKILGKDIIFNIFSDGTDYELKKVLELKNVNRVFFGSSIADILAMSRSKLIIASGSSFSMWSRFLGKSSCITYSNQLKEKLIGDSQLLFEIELNEKQNLSAEIKDQIIKMYLSTYEKEN